MKSLRSVLIYTATVFALSLAYFGYLHFTHPPSPEREGLMAEIGEVFGEFALWTLGIIYLRTALKLSVGRGSAAVRLLPDDFADAPARLARPLLAFLNRTHVYVAVILLHVGLMGLPMEILFFPAVLALVVWQAVFGLFMRWRYTPRELKKFSYMVHAQFATGIAIGVFAYFGHLLVED